MRKEKHLNARVYLASSTTILPSMDQNHKDKSQKIVTEKKGPGEVWYGTVDGDGKRREDGNVTEKAQD